MASSLIERPEYLNSPHMLSLFSISLTALEMSLYSMVFDFQDVFTK
jgi:hypothetical protein